MQSLKRFFAILFGGMAMLAVAVVCAFVSMRIAIHGREVEVPNLAGRSDADAAAFAKDLGLNLAVENRFYSSAVAPNHVLSQSPVAGARVRRGWQVRVTESLGQQKVAVPDVIGQTERPASLALRRLQLELGAIAHLPAPAPAGIVLAQSPPPNSNNMNGPRVALLVSEEETAAEAPAFVMPSIVGLTLSAASLRLATAGLHIASAQSPEETTPPDDGSQPASSSDPSAPAAYVAPAPITVSATITGQSPLPGHRVTRADNIRVSLSH
jgi:beta-lactam-binding protein with PASTA domain